MPADIFGDAPPRPPGGKKEQTATAKANAKQSVIVLARVRAVVNDPAIYALAAQLPEKEAGSPGRPADFPLYIYLLYNALTAVFQSARATEAHLADPTYWSLVREGVAQCLDQAAADALPETGPTRNQWLYNRKKLVDHLPALLDAFRERALAQALSQGLLDPNAPRSWSAPGQTQLVVGDGTIPKSPTKAQKPTSIDERTGELRHHRVDPGAGLHSEGGDENTKVWGPKFVFLSSRSPHYHERVVLDLRYQRPRHPGGEAALAVDSAVRLAGFAPGMLGVVWDGALRGVHRNSLAKAGLLAINKQHRGAKPEKITALRGPACYHDLYAADGRVTERTLTEDGTAEYRPIPVTRVERRESSDSCRWYHVLAIPCYRGVTHIHRVRLDQNEEDTKRAFNTAEHLRQIPPGTATFDRLYGHRPDSESLNALLDTTWRHKRIIAYGADRQTLAVLAFAQTQNAIARHCYLRRTATDQQLRSAA
ncbi:hypothetical protein KDK95_17620 [Actinospica sp. MGRD01-02]|uniref:Transposase n=1 Tax=Actinospica acidithermotolerans TaxID=2828514 RepID=A0A941E893_9ACTN|nr:hypothetical protein [Actinospica acidithermotolerans]MBR7828140.1 hypothetical protein [Actinospica acidithermotolerans]